MAFSLNNLIKETSATTGTGTLDLNGAESGYRTFVAGIGDGNTTYYVITDGMDFEIGTGTVTAGGVDTLSRDTILDSSNGGSAVVFGEGAKSVYCVVPAERAVYLDEAGTTLLVPDGAVSADKIAGGMLSGLGVDSATADNVGGAMTSTGADAVAGVFSSGAVDYGKLNSTGADDGQVLTADGSGGVAFEDASGGIDTNFSGLSSGDYMRYNGSSWANLTGASVWDDLKETASTSQAGIVELATTGETESGSSSSRAVTPAALRAALGFSEFFESSEQTFPDAHDSVSVSHGLGSRPTFFQVYMRCKSADASFSAGDERLFPGIFKDPADTSIWADTTTIGLSRAGSSSTNFGIAVKDGSERTVIDITKWRLVFRAWG